MKIKAVNLLIPLAGLYLVTSVHALESMNSVNALMRVFRLATIPFLAFIVLTLLPRQSTSKIQRLIFLAVPPVALLLINVLQLFALPEENMTTHVTGSVKFVAWFGLYFAVLLSLNFSSVEKIKSSILTILVAIFVFGILQYPGVIAQSGASLSTALSNYGQIGARYQLSGIFGSANEDANGFVTLLPLALLWVERRSGLKRKLLRWALLLYFPLILVFNGTRTALLVALPTVTMIFYLRLSLNQLLCIVGPAAGLGVALVSLSNSLVGRFFEAEAAGGGSFGWRIEHAWIPAISYTMSHSPIFGFGSRGWEFICYELGILKADGSGIVPSHSGYVWTFVAWGIAGFLAYVAFLAILLTEAFKLSMSKREDVAIAGRAFLGSAVGYCFWAFISNVMLPQGWLILISIATLIAAFKVSEMAHHYEVHGY
ncbi:MAG: O-antigen ligase family protein [Leptolyngbya sp. SIO4C1]|nr:O-antigen ligase family protein [Leptolyngbya sp. SIO4C1]